MQSNSIVTSVEVENVKNDNTAINESGQLNIDSMAAKKEKLAQKIETTKTIIAFLAEKFPNCFSLEGDAKALKLGIFQDIIDNEMVSTQFSKTNIRAALRYYTMSWRYLGAIIDGANRVDLAGESVGLVDAKQAEHAMKQLEEAKLKVKARQEANRKQFKKKSTQPHKPTENNQGKLNAKPRVNTRPAPSKSQPKTEIKPAAKVINEPKPKAETKKSIPNKAIEVATLKVGQQVNVLIGQSYAVAEVVEIAKENVRVSLPTGMILTVKHEHLTE